MNPELEKRLKALEAKYAQDGQKLLDHLDGLLERRYTTYWDYVKLDSLLSLQEPATEHHDEYIFIIYHQITELYFKMTLHELEHIADTPDMSQDDMAERLRRCVKYFEALENSYGVMERGMSVESYNTFRMALIPASGFQSAQYRKIEFNCAPLHRLVHKELRDSMKAEQDVDTLYRQIYWQRGGMDPETGEKTLTLRQFEAKYGDEFKALAHARYGNTISDRLMAFEAAGNLSEDLRNQARALDQYVNVLWPLQHMRTAARYLMAGGESVEATGGTNWQKYLAPRIQLRIFFPYLLSEDELANWGVLD